MKLRRTVLILVMGFVFLRCSTDGVYKGLSQVGQNQNSPTSRPQALWASCNGYRINNVGLTCNRPQIDPAPLNCSRQFRALEFTTYLIGITLSNDCLLLDTNGSSPFTTDSLFLNSDTPYSARTNGSEICINSVHFSKDADLAKVLRPNDKTNNEGFKNPLAGLPWPDGNSMTVRDGYFTLNNQTGAKVLYPGVYRSPQDLSGKFEFMPGIYLFEKFVSTNGSADWTGTGVTLYFKAALSMNGSATINLSPPSDTNLAMVSTGVRSALGTWNPWNLNGSQYSIKVNGLVYLMDSELSVNGSGLMELSALIAPGVRENGGWDIRVARDPAMRFLRCD